MNMKNHPLRTLVPLLLVGLSACGPKTGISPEGGPTDTGQGPSNASNAVAQQPTIALSATPEPTPTPSVTLTSTISPTNTATQTPTSTQTPDLRIILGDPIEFRLNENDFPNEPEYNVFERSAAQVTNAYLIANDDQNRQQEYIEITGRIFGRVITFFIQDSSGQGGYLVHHEIVQYKSFEGALLSVNDYDFWGENANPLEIDLVLGNFTSAWFNGEPPPMLSISVVYRNIVSRLAMWESTPDMIEYLILIQQRILEKLLAAPLTTP